MSRKELIELVGAMSMGALDLAQHLHWSVYCLKEEYVAEALENAVHMAYDLSGYPYAPDTCPEPDARVTIASFGAGGLTVERHEELSDAIGDLHDDIFDSEEPS